MRILVTNDDGIARVGLVRLVERLALRHDVVVVAPAGELSGAGAGLGPVENGRAVRVVPGSPAVPGVPWYAIDGPPALAVLAACTGALGPPPELVVSGVNPGFNTGGLLLHSGTFGAAATAAARGVAGIAVSTAREDGPGLSSATLIAGWLADWWGDRHAEGAADPVAVNVNVPDRPPAELVGVAAGAVTGAALQGVQVQSEPGAWRIVRTRSPGPFPAGSDAAVVTSGRVSLSVLRPIDGVAPDPTEWVRAIENRWAEESLDARTG